MEPSGSHKRWKKLPVVLRFGLEVPGVISATLIGQSSLQTAGFRSRLCLLIGGAIILARVGGVASGHVWRLHAEALKIPLKFT